MCIVWEKSLSRQATIGKIVNEVRSIDSIGEDSMEPGA